MKYASAIAPSAIAPFVVAAIVGAPSAALAKTQILFNVFVPPTHLIRTAIVDEWAKRVEARSNGSLRIRIPAKTLAPPPRQWGMVTDGIADATIMLNVFERKRLALIQMANLPLTGATARASSLALWRTHQEHFAKAGQFAGVKLLGFFMLPPGDLQSLGKPVRNSEDARNMKLRVSPGMAAKAAEAIGGVPVPTPGVKAYDVISKGVVDGNLMPVGEVVPFKIVSHVKHVTLIPGGIYNVGFSMFMNQKKFDGLSAAEQEAILGASGEHIGQDARAFDAQTEIGVQALKKAGATVAKADDAFMAELRKRLAPLQAEWIAEAEKAGIDGEAALKYYIEQGRELATKN